jgi:hypothetical protein
LPKCIDTTGVKGSQAANKKDQELDSTKEQRANRRHLWSGAPDCPVCHRTVSGAPPDMSGAPEDSSSNLPPSGISRGTRAIIHRTVRCTPDSVRCSKGGRPQELASLGFSLQPLRYNSPDCPVCTGLSGVHRTVRCICGVTATSGANGYLQLIYCAPVRAEVRHAHTGTPDSKQYLSGVHRTSRRARKSEAPTVRIQR